MPETAVNRSIRDPFDCLDRLNHLLAQSLLELNFLVSLLDDGPRRSLQVESRAILAVVTHIVEELEAAQQIVRRAFEQRGPR
ncbi:MAG TPA: hypothetical protein VFN13_08225 [Rudaea sp.]|nr:hypothetical protein [Rudaea sp.]